MERNITYNITDIDLNNLLKDVKIKEEESIINKYYNVLVPTAWVAIIHGVDPSTICRYVQRNLIPTVERNSSKGNYKFRLSDVLQIDIDKLRKTI